MIAEQTRIGFSARPPFLLSAAFDWSKTLSGFVRCDFPGYAVLGVTLASSAIKSFHR